MRTNQLAALTALGLLAGCVVPPPSPVAPPNSHPTVTATDGGSVITINNTLTTITGQPIRIGFFHDPQNPDCSVVPGEHLLMNVTVAASHGTVTIQPTTDFPNYPANSTMVNCNKMRVSGKLVTYAPQNGYDGVDQFSYRIFAPNGRELIVNTTVNITP